MYPVPDILPLNQGGCHDKDGDSKHNNCPELLTGIEAPVFVVLFRLPPALVFALLRVEVFLVAMSVLLSVSICNAAKCREESKKMGIIKGIVLFFLLVGRVGDICSKRQIEVIVWIGGKDTVYGKLTTLCDTFYHAGGGKTQHRLSFWERKVCLIGKHLLHDGTGTME